MHKVEVLLGNFFLSLVNIGRGVVIQRPAARRVRCGENASLVRFVCDALLTECLKCYVNRNNTRGDPATRTTTTSLAILSTIRLTSTKLVTRTLSK